MMLFSLMNKKKIETCGKMLWDTMLLMINFVMGTGSLIHSGPYYTILLTIIHLNQSILKKKKKKSYASSCLNFMSPTSLKMSPKMCLIYTLIILIHAMQKLAILLQRLK